MTANLCLRQVAYTVLYLVLPTHLHLIRISFSIIAGGLLLVFSAFAFEKQITFKFECKFMRQIKLKKRLWVTMQTHLMACDTSWMVCQLNASRSCGWEQLVERSPSIWGVDLETLTIAFQGGSCLGLHAISACTDYKKKHWNASSYMPNSTT